MRAVVPVLLIAASVGLLAAPAGATDTDFARQCEALVARPSYFASLAQGQSGLRQQVDAVLTPLTRSLQDGIVAANREIDSPASCQALSPRLNGCP